MSSVGLLHMAALCLGSALPFPRRCSRPLGALHTGAGHEGAWLSAGQKQDVGTRRDGVCSWLHLTSATWLQCLIVTARHDKACQSSMCLMLPVISRLCPHFTLRWQTRSCITPALPVASAESVSLDSCSPQGWRGSCGSEAPISLSLNVLWEFLACP